MKRTEINEKLSHTTSYSRKVFVTEAANWVTADGEKQ